MAGGRCSMWSHLPCLWICSWRCCLTWQEPLDESGDPRVDRRLRTGGCGPEAADRRLRTGGEPSPSSSETLTALGLSLGLTRYHRGRFINHFISAFNPAVIWGNSYLGLCRGHFVASAASIIVKTLLNTTICKLLFEFNKVGCLLPDVGLNHQTRTPWRRGDDVKLCWRTAWRRPNSLVIITHCHFYGVLLLN